MACSYRVEVSTRVPLVAEDVLVRGEQQTTLEVTEAGTLGLRTP